MLKFCLRFVYHTKMFKRILLPYCIPGEQHSLPKVLISREKKGSIELGAALTFYTELVFLKIR